MKKIMYLYIILFLSSINSLYTNNKNINTHDNSNSSYSLLVEESAIITKKYAAFIAFLPFVIYYHNNIINFSSDHPFIAGFGLYFLINYICDCILEYQEQKPLFDCIPLIKKLALDLVICHGIHNYIHQKKIAIAYTNNDQIFFNNLTEDMHYSFDQVEFMTLHMYKQLKKRLHSFQHTIHIESQECLFLYHTSCIDMQTMLYVTEDDPELHTMIYDFEQNPIGQLIPLLKFIKQDLYNNFTQIQHLLIGKNIIMT